MRQILTLLLLMIAFIPIAQVEAKEEVTRVILVRHGETDYNKEDKYQGTLDIPLNETGIKQAELLAESLKDIPIDVFISSQLSRAYLTTKICADKQGKTIAYTDKRFEETDYGDWAGKSKKEIKKLYPKESKMMSEQRWKFTPPHGESLKQIERRYREALEDAVKKYPGKTIFIGAHSKGNMALLCSVMNIGLKHFHDIAQDNTCVNVLEYKNGKWKVILMNSVQHLGYLYKGAKK